MSLDIQRIREASDLCDVVREYGVNLRRSGAQLVGLCPFHGEKTPSFSVHPQKQLYHCHGCGAGGDVFSFTKEIEGIDFPEALKILADRAGLSMQRMSASERRGYAITREEIDEAEYFAIRERLRVTERGILLEMYRRRCAADAHYRGWLLDDKRNAEEMTAALVAILVMAQERASAGAAG